MNKTLILILLLFGMLHAAEIRDGVLYLEINISTEKEIELSGESFRISENDPLFGSDYSSAVRLSLPPGNQETRFGIIRRVVDEGAQDYQDGVLSSKFVWQDGRLALRREYAIYREESFADYDTALGYAHLMGYPAENIRQIPIVNAALRVDSAQGAQDYFESPIRILAEDGIKINGFTYKGEFIAKVVEGKITLNHLLPLEAYIAGVVPNEIGSSSPPQALRAQAVAARSHAVSLLGYNRHSKDGYDLCSGTHCQVYKGEHLQNEAIEEAVMHTSGEILYIDDKVADATYHSSCGGKTDSSTAIWNGAPLDHLAGSICIDAARELDLTNEAQAIRWINTPLNTQGMTSWERAAMNWQRTITKEQLARNLGLKYLTSVQIASRGSSGRILAINFFGDRTIRLSGEFKIRQSLGNLPSALFYIQGISSRSKSPLGNQIIIKGRGSGHGVGMCQIGVLRKARKGEDYQSILQNYYPRTTIIKNWMENEERQIDSWLDSQ